MSADEHSQLIARNRERYAVERNLARTSASSAGSAVIDIGKSQPTETEPEKPARTNPDDTLTAASSSW